MLQGRVRAPSIRRTYGLLAIGGMSVLAAGLALPFAVASPAPPDATPATSGLLGGLGQTGGHGGTTLPAHTGSAKGGATGSVNLGAATTTSSLRPTAGTRSPTAAPPVPGLTASDVGVTPSSIKIGIPVANLSNLGQLGATFGDPQLQWEAYIANLNSKGGILGRTIQPVFVTMDLTSPDSQEAACINLTEQAKVFAVLQSGGYFGAPILCLTQQHKTPFIGESSGNDYYYQESNGLFFSMSPDNDRALKNLVAEMQRDGVLAGKTIGVLDDGSDDSLLVNETLLPALHAIGVKVTYRISLSSDASTAESQIPVAIQQMQADGVNLVLPVASFLAADIFAQEADSNGYHPAYVLSDVDGGGTNNYASYMPASFDGNIAYTALNTGNYETGVPDAPQDAACAQTYTAETGKPLDHANEEFLSAVTACGILNLFATGATSAGPTLTRTGLSLGLQHIGQFPLPFGSVGSFGSTKFDAPAAARKVVWRYRCKCWLPDGNFSPDQY